VWERFGIKSHTKWESLAFKQPLLQAILTLFPILLFKTQTFIFFNSTFLLELRKMAITHADLEPSRRKTDLSSKTGAFLMVLTILIGLFCFVLCLIAEATRSEVQVWYMCRINMNEWMTVSWSLMLYNVVDDVGDVDEQRWKRKWSEIRMCL